VAQCKDDLEKISEVLFHFFDFETIRSSLNTIHKFKISGWEKWWQTEFAFYLANSGVIAKRGLEHSLDTDRRTLLAQSRMALDIGFRLKITVKMIGFSLI
jgi:hypothetical protein